MSAPVAESQGLGEGGFRSMHKHAPSYLDDECPKQAPGICCLGFLPGQGRRLRHILWAAGRRSESGPVDGVPYPGQQGNHLLQRTLLVMHGLAKQSVHIRADLQKGAREWRAGVCVEGSHYAAVDTCPQSQLRGRGLPQQAGSALHCSCRAPQARHQLPSLESGTLARPATARSSTALASAQVRRPCPVCAADQTLLRYRFTLRT